MVDSIGMKTGSVSDRRIVSVGAVDKIAPVKPSASEAPAVQSAAAQTASALGAHPPIDTDRVARIRKAVQEGRFPLVPSTIADRLLALKLEWKPNEPA